MTYQCRNAQNPIFPYGSREKIRKPPSSSSKTDNHEKKQPLKNANTLFSGLFDSFLGPVEKLLGRKIKFDDLLLVGLIYLLFTEKENEDTSLLLCLLFILLG